MKKIAVLFATLLSFFASQAHAALGTDVTTAMSDGLADVKTLGAAALIIVIAVAVFKKMRGAA